MIKRGDRIIIKPHAVPEDAVDDRHHTRESALVINVQRQRPLTHGPDRIPKTEDFYAVMFNAGPRGVIFTHVLQSEIDTEATQ